MHIIDGQHCRRPRTVPVPNNNRTDLGPELAELTAPELLLGQLLFQIISWPNTQALFIPFPWYPTVKGM